MTPAEAAEILRQFKDWKGAGSINHEEARTFAGLKYETSHLARCYLDYMVQVARMRSAIERALADEESGTGWGPDVTVCGYLREAIT